MRERESNCCGFLPDAGAALLLGLRPGLGLGLGLGLALALALLGVLEALGRAQLSVEKCHFQRFCQRITLSAARVAVAHLGISPLEGGCVGGCCLFFTLFTLFSFVLLLRITVWHLFSLPLSSLSLALSTLAERRRCTAANSTDRWRGACFGLRLG